jgi:5'-nucleotidase
MKKLLFALSTLCLFGCATVGQPIASSEPVSIRIIGINDFHGNLDPPKLTVPVTDAKGETAYIPVGGAAYIASAVDMLKSDAPNNIVVAAGDLIGATPLSSSLFLDEPAIMAMNMIGLEFNALGNHEFDRGPDELKRMQYGGCEKITRADPCRVDRPFLGAKFKMLAANTIQPNGKTLFPPYALKSFGKGKAKVIIGFIGLTLTDTKNLVMEERLHGIRFSNETETANALVPTLKAAGANVIVLLIHQGVVTTTNANDPQCGGISGDLMPIIDKLDPAISVVVSGHTHRGYVCEYGKINPARPVLLTSAGKYGEYVTGIDLKIDPLTKKLLSRSARNIAVQSEAFTSARGPAPLNPAFPIFKPRADVAALALRYADAAKIERNKVIGSLAGPATRKKSAAGESILGNLIADAQLAAMRPPESGGAQIAFMNPYGMRTDILPEVDGMVTFGSVFASQPFSNQLVVKSLTGKQIHDVLEQQFFNMKSVNILSPSTGFRFGFDVTRPAGQRILFATLNGQPLQDNMEYRVAMSDFLAGGGDNFAALKAAKQVAIGPIDVDALIAYLARDGITPLPTLDRVEGSIALKED